MTEIATCQEREDIEEMPSSLEMGELRKITTLQDISLADGGVNLQESKEDNERKLKTNSLKRFFRLSPKKKFADSALESEKSGELETDEAPPHEQKGLSNSYSKSSLKSSLSGYWTSVFKHKKSGKTAKISQELETIPNEASTSMTQSFDKENQDNVCNPKDKNVLEEIQSLSISEDCTPHK